MALLPAELQNEVWKSTFPDAPDNVTALEWLLPFIESRSPAAREALVYLPTAPDQGRDVDIVKHLQRRTGPEGETVWISRKLSNIRWNLKRTVLEGVPVAFLSLDHLKHLFDSTVALQSNQVLVAAVACLHFIRVARELVTVELSPKAGLILVELLYLAREESVVELDTIFAHLDGRLPEAELLKCLEQLEALGCIRHDGTEIVMVESVDFAQNDMT